MTQGEKLNREEAAVLAEMAGALAHPSRIAIMCLLSKDEQAPATVKFIYSHLGQSQPVISRHLGVLRNAGLLQKYKSGKKTFYHISDHKLAQSISDFFRQSYGQL